MGSWLLVAVSLAGLAIESLAQETVDSNSSCYFPNGELISTHKPCGPSSSDGHTFCCNAATQICLSNKLCFSTKDMTLRTESCTDENWDSGNCPDTCETWEREEAAELFPLDLSTGEWCCDGVNYTGTEPGCVGATVRLGEGGLVNVFDLLEGGNATETRTSSGSEASSETGAPVREDGVAPPAAAAEGDSGTSERGTQLGIGLGLGIPLGLALLAVAGLLSRKRAAKRGGRQRVGSHSEGEGFDAVDSKGYPLSSRGLHEAGGRRPGELFGRSTPQELYGAKGGAAEMSG